MGSVENYQQQINDQSNIKDDDVPPPSNAVEALQRWNDPPENKWKVLATFWSFLILGMNDGSYGALVPFVGHLLSLALVHSPFNVRVAKYI